MRDLVTARPRRFDPCLAAGFFFPRRAHRGERVAGGAIRLGKTRLGLGPIVGRLLARFLGRFDLAHQSLTGGQKYVRRLGKSSQLFCGFLAPRFQRADLAARAIAAGMPGLALFLDAAKTLCARLGVAQMGLQFSAGFGHRGAIVRRRRACHVEPRGQLRRGVQLGERRFGLRVLFAGFAARGIEAEEGFFERREPRGGRGLVLFGRSLFRAGRLDVAQRVLVRLSCRVFGGGGGGKSRLGQLRIGFQDAGGAARGFRFDREIAEAVFFGETPRGGSRGFGGLRETVPAPQIAFLRDQPLAGFQQRPQGGSFGPRDNADLVQPPRERSWRRDEPRERFDARRQSRVVRRHRSGPNARAKPDWSRRRDRRRAPRRAPPHSLSRR